MAKIKDKEIPIPGAGGTYLFDPKTGKTTLVPEPETPTENGPSKKDSNPRED